MTEKTCAQCGTPFTPTGKRQSYCQPRCVADARNDRLRMVIPEKTCEQCGAAFKPRVRRQRFCCYRHGVLFQNAEARSVTATRKASKPKAVVTPAPKAAIPARQEVAIASSQATELLAYILSDSIFSGAIPDEVAKLKATPKAARAAVRKQLDSELATTVCLWPSSSAGRLALLHYLLEFPHRPRFRHPHERPPRLGRRLPSGFAVRTGIR